MDLMTTAVGFRASSLVQGSARVTVLYPRYNSYVYGEHFI